MVDRGQLAWAPVWLETENVEFDTCCLGTTAETLGVWEVSRFHKDSQTRTCIMHGPRVSLHVTASSPSRNFNFTLLILPNFQKHTFPPDSTF